MTSYSRQMFFILLGLMLSSLLSGQEPNSSKLDSLQAQMLLWEADSLVNEQNFELALSKAEKARKVLTSLLGPKTAGVANSWYQIAKIYYNQFNYDSARIAWDTCLTIRLVVLGESNLDVAQCYNDLGGIFFLQGKFEKASQYFEKSLNIRLDIQGENHRQVAESYNNLGGIFLKQGKYDQAIFYYERALAIVRNVLGDGHTDVAKLYTNLGGVYSYKRNFEKGSQYINKALEIFLTKYNELHPTVANCYNNLGSICKDQGKFDQGILHYEKALNIFLAIYGKDSKSVAIIYGNLGGLYSNLQQYDRGIHYYESALSIGVKTLGLYHPDIADFYSGLGLIYHNQNKYDKAILYHEKALEIRLKTLGKLHLDTAYSYHNLGGAYYYQGKTEKAIYFYNKALEIKLKILGESDGDLATTYNGLGILYDKLGQYEKAIVYYEKALNIDLKYFGESHYFVADSYLNLGLVYFHQGEYEKAILSFEKALDIQLVVLPKAHPSIANTYKSLGVVYGKRNKYTEAIQFYTKALKVLNFTSIDSLEKVTSLSLLTSTLELMGKLHRQHYLKTKDLTALYQGKTVLQHTITALDYQFKTFGESSKTQIVNDAFFVCDEAISTYHLLSKATSSFHDDIESFNFTERAKSFLLYEAIKESAAITFANIPNNLLKNEYTLRTNIDTYEKLHREKIIAGLNETDTSVLAVSSILFDLKHEYENLKTHLEKDFPDYYRLKYDLSTVSVEEVQQELLNPTQTLLEYFVGDSSIYLFVIQKNDYQVLEIKKDFPLDSLVHQLREGLYGYHQAPKQTVALQQESINKYNAAAEELYQRLIAPAKNHLSESLIIIPDGPLNYIPFEALLETEVKDLYDFSSYPYLIKNHRVSYCYSATLLREMQQKQHKKEPKKSLLAFAPFYKGSYEYLQDMLGHVHQSIEVDTLDWIINRSDFAELPNSGEEVSTISQLWNGDYYIDQDATEERFNQIAGDYRILHLSTHGIADSRVGDYSYLAFSEVKDSIENELLYVRDLYNLQLNADLVVLSACETGIGELQRGEGMVSLARAFSYAGAKSIVSSLWVVKDVATKHLMQRFHRQLKLGSGKDRALQEAKLQYIKDFPGEMSHPYFWAGFVGIGDMGRLIKN